MVVLLLFLATPGQLTSGAQDAPVPSYRIDAYSALLEVRVFDREGNPVSGLVVSDFRVVGGNKPCSILYFEERVNHPISLVILVDVGSAMTEEKVGMAKQIIFDLIHLLDPADQIALAVYAEETVFLAELTRDRLHLLEAIANTSASRKAGFWQRLGSAYASNALTGPAIDEGLLRLKKAEHDIRAVLVFSSAFGSLGQGTLDHLALSNSRVFGVGWPNRAGDAFNLWGDRTSRNEILIESGGALFRAETIRHKLDSLSASLKNCYLMAYDPPDQDEGRPEVTVASHPDLRVTFRRRMASDNAFY